MPARACDRIWVLAPTAALAETWSTALMLVEPDEISGILAEVQEIAGVHAEIHGRIEAYGFLAE
jgi:thiamine biosynthesis lipoprotein ApbE